MNTFVRLFRRSAAVVVMLAALNATAEAAGNNHIQDHSADVSGVTLHYLQAGAGDALPVVLLHGYAETSHMWRPLMPKLAATHVVIAPDLRGAGQSPSRKAATTRKPWRRTSMPWCRSWVTRRCASSATTSG